MLNLTRENLTGNKESRDFYLLIETGEYISSRRLAKNTFINDEYKIASYSDDLFNQALEIIGTTKVEEILVKQVDLNEESKYLIIDYPYYLNSEFIATSRSDNSKLNNDDFLILNNLGIRFKSNIESKSYEDSRINEWLKFVNKRTIFCSKCDKEIGAGGAFLEGYNGKCWECYHEC